MAEWLKRQTRIRSPQGFEPYLFRFPGAGSNPAGVACFLLPFLKLSIIVSCVREIRKGSGSSGYFFLFSKCGGSSSSGRKSSPQTPTLSRFHTVVRMSIGIVEGCPASPKKPYFYRRTERFYLFFFRGDATTSRLVLCFQLNEDHNVHAIAEKYPTYTVKSTQGGQPSKVTETAE